MALNENLIDAVTRFTNTDVDAFRREWNAQIDGKAETPEKQAVFEKTQKKIQAKNLLEGGISARVLMKYTSLSGELKEREVVIRRVFKNGKGFLLDVLCLDINAPRIIKLQNVLQVTDKITNKSYTYKEFFKDILALNAAKETANSTSKQPSSAPIGESSLKDGELKTAIDRTRHEITALLFISAVDGQRDERELQKIIEYVHKRCPDLTFDDSKLLDYLHMNYPDTQSFYFSLERIVGNEGWIVKMFLEKLMALIVADGRIDDKEKLFLAESMRRRFQWAVGEEFSNKRE